MREIIPSLATTYTVASILFLMLLLSGISLYFNARKKSDSQRALFWLKLIIGIPLLLFGIVWTISLTTAFGVLLLVSNLELKYLFLTLFPIGVYAVLVWVLIRWIKNKHYANISIIIGIIVTICFIYMFQHTWICKPLENIGIDTRHDCTTRHDLELQDIERERQQKLEQYKPDNLNTK